MLLSKDQFHFFFKVFRIKSSTKIKVPEGHEDLKNGMRYQIHLGIWGVLWAKFFFICEIFVKNYEFRNLNVAHCGVCTIRPYMYKAASTKKNWVPKSKT